MEWNLKCLQGIRVIRYKAEVLYNSGVKWSTHFLGVFLDKPN